MTREEWQLVKRIASAALDEPDVSRPAYVTSACQGDEALEREVRSLLSFTDGAAHRFETAAFEWPAIAADRLRHAIDQAHGRGSVDAPSRFLPGTIINGRYRVEDVAGTGGMGAVYRVTDLSQPRTLALKTIRGDTPFVNLFKIEFRTLGALRHPHLARSHDFEAIAGSTDYCFTMDFVDGRNIFDATDTVRWPEIVDLLVQLCRALAYVHNRGVVHRDIKPNNVLVQPNRTLKLVDFGLVGALANDGPLLGTPAYVAPELIERRPGDHRSDLYSLGILTYELLCRRLPVVTDPFPDGIDAPGWLQAIVLRLCAREPADRFRGANQIIETINRHSGSSYPVETAATRESYVVSGRFVGRQHELSALSTFVGRRLRAETPTTGPLAFISGQSGVGKSRLIHELRCELQLDRQVFVEGHCFEGAADEYGAFAEIIAQLLPRLESKDAHALVERHLSELAKVAPNIGWSRPVEQSPALTTPDAERRRLLDSVAEFLVDASAFVPYVIHVNDLQWAPLGTVEILRYLHRRIDIGERQNHRVRLVVVGSYRGDEIAGRPLESLFEEAGADAMALALAPLSSESMRRLLSSMFGLEDIPEPFVARVLDEAAGSPFFLEEVVRALVEQGSVFVADGQWRTTRTVGELEMPVTVAAALRRRVAMVADPRQLRVLQVLAAYQKPIATSLLSAVTQLSPEDVDQALYDLSGRHMVTAVSSHAPLYRTAHDHLRTTVYADLATDAAGLHRAIARALEGQASGGDAPLSELAHHYWLAQDREEALKYGLLAGESALAVYANDEAIQHLEHALELLPPDASPVRTRTTEQLADAYFLAGHYARTRSLLVDVSRTTVGTVNAVRVQRKLGEVVGRSAGTPHEAVDILWGAARDLGAKRPPTRSRFLGRSVTALVRHFVQQLFAGRLVEDASERTRLTELASIYLRIAYFNFFGDPMLFFLPVLRAANVIDRVGEGKEHSNVYSLVGIALAGLGFTARAHRYGQRAIAEAERSGSPWHIANARSFHAIVLLQMGQWDQALADAERARTGFAACGDHFELAVTLYQILELLQARGELPAAVARGREELAMFERLGLQMIGKGPFTQFGRALAKTGDVEGLAVGTDVLERAEHGADKLSTVLAHLGLGDSCLHLERVDDAIDHLERGLAIRDRDRFDVYVAAEGSALLVRAYAAKLRAGEATYSGDFRRRFDWRVSQAVGAGRRFPPMRSAASLVLGLQCRLQGRRARATRCFAAAAAHAAELGAKIWQADAHFENGLACLDDEGRASVEAKLELERALALYGASGALRRERRTQELLSTIAVA